jgi:prepilin-type N-terminal cleavage/methylation domain-containing protein
MSRLLDRLRSERGFTLVEMMVAAAVGSIVMIAIFMLLDTSVKQSGTVNARVDSTQRGRTAMETITRELRSQVCYTPDTNPAVSLLAAQPYSITFYAFHGNTTFAPDKRTIAWDTNTNTIKETIAPASGAGTTRTLTLLTNVTPLSTPANTPIFEYHQTDGTLLSSTPLSTADMAKTSIIRIRFQTAPGTRATTSPSTSFESQVFVRTADPNGLAGSTAPACT